MNALREALLPGVIFMALGGCAVAPPPASDADKAEASRQLTCMTADQCALWWRRVQVFVSTYSAYRVRIATDTLIETFGPVNYQPGFALTVLRVPMANPGMEGFIIRGACGVVCPASPETLTADMKRFVRDNRPPPRR